MVSFFNMGIGIIIKLAFPIFLEILAGLWVAINTSIIVAITVFGTDQIHMLFGAVVFILAISIHEVTANWSFHIPYKYCCCWYLYLVFFFVLYVLYFFLPCIICLYISFNRFCYVVFSCSLL